MKAENCRPEQLPRLETERRMLELPSRIGSICGDGTKTICVPIMDGRPCSSTGQFYCKQFSYFWFPIAIDSISFISVSCQPASSFNVVLNNIYYFQRHPTTRQPPPPLLFQCFEVTVPSATPRTTLPCALTTLFS